MLTNNSVRDKGGCGMRGSKLKCNAHFGVRGGERYELCIVVYGATLISSPYTFSLTASTGPPPIKRALKSDLATTSAVYANSDVLTKAEKADELQEEDLSGLLSSCRYS